MKKLFRFFWLFFTVALFGSACTKKADGILGPVGPAGSSGPAGSGGSKPSAIFGYVHLMNQFGFPDSTNAGLTASTKKGDTVVTAITDQDGKFILPALPLGNYNILFKKSGYDSLKVYVQHSGGDEDKFIGDVTLYGHVTTKITSQATTALQSPYAPPGIFDLLAIDIHFDGPPATVLAKRDFGFYFSRSSQVSSSQYDLSTTTWGSTTSTNANNYSLQYSLQNFTASGINFGKGDTVYIKTFVFPVNGSQSSWFDYDSYKNIEYPYAGDSSLTYFIWPN